MKRSFFVALVVLCFFPAICQGKEKYHVIDCVMSERNAITYGDDKRIAKVKSYVIIDRIEKHVFLYDKKPSFDVCREIGGKEYIPKRKK